VSIHILFLIHLSLSHRLCLLSGICFPFVHPCFSSRSGRSSCLNSRALFLRQVTVLFVPPKVFGVQLNPPPPCPKLDALLLWQSLVVLQLTEADSNSHSLQNSITECVLLRCVSLHVDSLGLISQMHNGYHQVSFFPHKLVVFFFFGGNGTASFMLQSSVAIYWSFCSYGKIIRNLSELPYAQFNIVAS
jgi:hypothetical protein